MVRDVCRVAGRVSAVGWVRQRLRLVRRVLITVVSLPADLSCGTAPALVAFGRLFATASVLLSLRGVAAAHLAALPRPPGFRPPDAAAGGRNKAVQHVTGPDPPADSGQGGDSFHCQESLLMNPPDPRQTVALFR